MITFFALFYLLPGLTLLYFLIAINRAALTDEVKNNPRMVLLTIIPVVNIIWLGCFLVWLCSEDCWVNTEEEKFVFFKKIGSVLTQLTDWYMGEK